MPKPGSWDASLKLRLHCNASPNNTIATLTKENGSTIAWFSGGSCGFKKANRASYEAGYQCAVRLFKKIEDLHRAQGPVSVQLYFKGFGQGRDALKAALLATEGESIRPLVESVTDRTPIKIGGTRAKKMPRL
ncbi:translational machinery component [Coprinopsis marcescibilis]|uniref:Translational machinery component n=1 Tax=Coprinopsis marcescibilis TaxID=230819 RepID=A0A5C3L245_COPMA|nr:translational machinery component [Coprinopsis marcescibilis]